MKVLVVSDEINKYLYSRNIEKFNNDIDLIISCGDLPDYYLDFLVSNISKPLVYVCGNHDKYDIKVKPENRNIGVKISFENASYNYEKNIIGGKNIDQKCFCFNNIIFCGLEGSMKYNNGDHQYTERQMFFKILGLLPRLIFNKITKGRFLDVLITHTPPRGYGDQDDLPHRGFKVFLKFIDIFKPKYLLHGHIHIYDRNKNRVLTYKNTKIINCYDYLIIDL